MQKRRKPRSDSNYIIYKVVDDQGNVYIGLTRKTESTAIKSMKRRWAKHVSRAKCQQDLEWALYKHIREVEIVHWEHEILEVIRGRAEAYRKEREFILAEKPNLNTQYNKEEVCNG